MPLSSCPKTHSDHRLFIGIFPGGIVYADRHHEQYGDYKHVAFFPYDTLCLDVKKDCPHELLAEVKAHAATLQLRRGELFCISTCGQAVRLG